MVVALTGLGFGFDGGRSIVIFQGFDGVGLGCVVYFGGRLVWVYGYELKILFGVWVWWLLWFCRINRLDCHRKM